MTIESTDFDYVRDLLYRRTAVFLEQGKEYLVDSRLFRLVREHGFGSLAGFVDHLRCTPLQNIEDKVVEALLTNETWFFRDYHPFDVLRKYVIPLLRNARKPGEPIRIWSAACATGQEPYSLAITAMESHPPLAAEDVEILASDISESTLRLAKEGLYTQFEVNRGMPAPYLVKYFRKEGVNWRLHDEVISRVKFRRLNLNEPWSMPDCDVIFLRNVLIYFDIPTRKRILTRVRQTLRQDGFLFLGGAETTFNLDPSYTHVEFDGGTCYQLLPRREEPDAI